MEPTVTLDELQAISRKLYTALGDLPAGEAARVHLGAAVLEIERAILAYPAADDIERDKREVAAEIRRRLAEVQGSQRAAVAMAAGLTVEEIDAVGGMPDDGDGHVVGGRRVPDFAAFADAVAKRRKELKLSQADVAEAGGPSDTTQSKIELQKAAKIGAVTLARYDTAFGWPSGTAYRILHGSRSAHAAQPAARSQPDAGDA